MLKNGCETGCKKFYGGETKHHKDCQFYQNSMSSRFDELEKEVEYLRVEAKKNVMDKPIKTSFFLGVIIVSIMIECCMLYFCVILDLGGWQEYLVSAVTIFIGIFGAWLLTKR